MSAGSESAIEQLLQRWESKNPGTPVRPVVERAVDLGFTVAPSGGWRSGRNLRLAYEPRSGQAVTLHVDALQLTAAGADVRGKAAAVPGAVVRRKDVQFPFDAVDPAKVLGVFSGATAEKRLEIDGEPVADDARFVVAVNNYRRSGGGGFPHISTAPVVYNEQLEIRQLLIEWAQECGVIDPADFYVENGQLVRNGEPLPG